MVVSSLKTAVCYPRVHCMVVCLVLRSDWLTDQTRCLSFMQSHSVATSVFPVDLSLSLQLAMTRFMEGTVLSREVHCKNEVYILSQDTVLLMHHFFHALLLSTVTVHVSLLCPPVQLVRTMPFS